MQEPLGEYYRIKIDLIDANPSNPREKLKEIKELSDDINRNGLLNPLTVRKASGGRYSLLAGHRRLAALRALEWEYAPCHVHQGEQQSHVIALSENLQRNGLTSYEQAKAFRELMQSGMSAEQIAEKCGLSPKTVRQYSGILVPGRLTQSVEKAWRTMPDIVGPGFLSRIAWRPPEEQDASLREYLSKHKAHAVAQSMLGGDGGGPAEPTSGPRSRADDAAQATPTTRRQRPSLAQLEGLLGALSVDHETLPEPDRAYVLAVLRWVTGSTSEIKHPKTRKIIINPKRYLAEHRAFRAEADA